MFDILILCGPNDADIIDSCIEYSSRNILGYRRIYVISYNPSYRNKCIICVPERIFPFSKEEIISKGIHPNRAGWYFQQLIKLYAGFVIHEMLDYYLVIDADTLFLKPTEFFCNDLAIYTIDEVTSYQTPYIEHMKRLNRNFKLELPVSGISHHMMFRTSFVRELFNLVEFCANVHSSKNFWEIFIDSIDDKIKPLEIGSGASEYEIYLNYIIKYNSDRMCLRRLNWIEHKRVKDISQFKEKYDYISLHHYLK